MLRSNCPIRLRALVLKITDWASFLLRTVITVRSVRLMPSFNNLAKQYNAADVSGEPRMGDSTPDRTTLSLCLDTFPALADVT